MNLETYKVHWCKFTDYYKYCDQLAFYGGCYGLVFSEVKPEPYQYPYEFEECIYIGESAGHYMDRKSKHKQRPRSHIHNRMGYHLKPLSTGDGGDSSHKTIIKKYGFGRDVLDGTLTDKPLWLALIVPNPDWYKQGFMKTWVMYEESRQIAEYIMKWDKTPLGNLDRDDRKNPNSYSSQELILNQDLTEFFG